jgi:hypothetical protein
MQRAEPWKVNPRELKVPVRFEVADLGALEEGDAVGVDLRDGDGNRIQPDSGDRWAYRLPLESRVLVSAGRAPQHGLLEVEPAQFTPALVSGQAGHRLPVKAFDGSGLVLEGIGLKAPGN